MRTTLVGFDSAWADNPKSPGAICAIHVEDGGFRDFHPPRLVGFEGALAFIDEVAEPDDVVLVALDQPTIVRNGAGMRAAERVVASLLAWTGGGVQPANRGRLGMFDDGAPIWRFLGNLGAIDDPELARTATRGRFVIEVFPALALLAYDPAFFGPRQGARYNPARRTFRSDDWRRVGDAVRRESERLGCPDDVPAWLDTLPSAPCKADQDRLDAFICLQVAARWRLGPRADSVMVGDLETGYVVSPVSPDGRRYLVAKAGATPGRACVRVA